MKKMIRRIFVIMLALLLPAASAAPLAFAAQDACDGCHAGLFSGLAACLTESGALHVCDKNFPDAHFRAFAAKQFDADGDGALSEAEAQAVVSADCRAARIADLTGIGYFSRLAELNCSGNQLEKLDLSANKALTALDCSDNAIALLDLSGNAALKTLSASGQTLELPLDTEKNRVDLTPKIGKNTSDRIVAVGAFDAKGNSMDATEAAGVVAFAAADPLYAEYTVDTGLAGEALGSVKVRVYPYTDGEFAGLPARVAAGRLLVSEKNFPDPAFRQFVGTTAAKDGHTLTADELSAAELRCADKGIGDLTGISFFADVQTLDCSSNALVSLNVSSCAALKELNCSGNQLTSLLLGTKEKLETLRCGGNGLITLDLSGCKALKALDCSDNHLAALDLSGNPALKADDVKLSGQTLGTLNCAKIRGVYLLDLSEYVGDGHGTNVVSVTAVTADGTDAAPEYSGSTGAVRFRLEPDRVTYRYFTAAADKSIPYLEVTAKASTAALTCVSGVFNGSDAFVLDGMLHLCDKNFPDEAFRNAVKAFDTDGDGFLSTEEAAKAETLKLNSSGIGSLRGVEYLTSLTSLAAADNALTELDLSKNTALTALNCSANRLSFLDLSANAALEAANVTMGSQTGRKLSVKDKGGKFAVSLAEALGTDRTANVTAVSDKNGAAAAYDSKTGEAVFEKTPESPVTYSYDPGLKNGAAAMNVVCELLPGVEGHSHTALTPVPAKAATCTETGHAAYFTCTCGRFFADEKATVEIADLQYITFPATNHAKAEAYTASALFHWNVCKNPGCDAIMEGTKKYHSDDNADGKCDVCGYDLHSRGVLGDVDGDGELMPADARLALRLSIGLEAEIPRNSVKFVTADVDLDDKVTPADARLILRASVQLDTLKDPLAPPKQDA